MKEAEEDPFAFATAAPAEKSPFMSPEPQVDEVLLVILRE